MAKDLIDYVLTLVQILSLIFLIIYVIKTWQMASATKESAKISEMTLHEMKETRDEEYAPYVVIYFDYSKQVMELVIKNIGKTIAKNVRLQFDPNLINSQEEKFDSLINEKIDSIPPGYEIRSFFDLSHSYFQKKSSPLKYTVKIIYFGNKPEKEILSSYILDLTHLESLLFLESKGMDELVKAVEQSASIQKNIEKSINNINSRMNNGLWVKNPSINFKHYDKSDKLDKIILSKLNEFRLIWIKYENSKNMNVNPFITDFKNEITFISTQLIQILSCYPEDDNRDILNKLSELSHKIAELGRFNTFALSNVRINEFHNLGQDIIKKINELLIEMKSDDYK